MGIIEMASALGVSKALVSKLAKRGMPVTSAQAAQAWREEHAPPRQWKARTPAPPAVKVTTRPSVKANLLAPDPAPRAPAAPADPSESLRRAHDAERSAYDALRAMQKTGSPEDLRKLSGTYFSARNNHSRARADFESWQRNAGITLYADEAKEICNRGHLAVSNMLKDGPKTLAPRLYNMPQKSIERTLAEWLDGIGEHLRKSF